VGRRRKETLWYLSAAIGALVIGGFFVAVGAVQALVTKDQLSSNEAKVSAWIALVVGVAAIAGAAGMNGGRAWGWLVGVIVSSLIVLAGVVALAGASRGLGAALTLLTGILLLIALLLPGSRVIWRTTPPRPDETDQI
jgi:hypothetical protein